MHLEAKRREVSDETARKELRLEMERRRALDTIYRDRQDLKIEVEPVANIETSVSFGAVSETRKTKQYRCGSSKK